MAWICEYCNKKFENKKDCEEHEVKCKKFFDKRIQKIFVNKGKKFFCAGSILFFGELSLIFLFGLKNIFLASLFLVGGLILILIGIFVSLFDKKDINFVCKNCGKVFIRQDDCANHLIECK